ncbi:MAG: Integrin beta chain domain, partial [Frankiales bacterium]|nr:Integrin beta chain domain [Frankiales bacterium]
MRRPRLRSALLVAAVLSAGLPTIALAGVHDTAPALHCGVAQHGSWETIHIDSFKPVQALSSPDTVSAWTVDESRPQDLAVTNGVRIQTTTDHGCSWSDALALQLAPGNGQSFAGAGAKIVSLALLGSARVAAVQEGTGAASRPHVLVGSGGSWVTADSGLPSQGAPKLLRAANDGRTLYLTISPTGGSGGSTSGLPGLPVGGGGDVSSQTGLLYASTDRGHTWTLRTTANDLPSGGTGFSALDVDSSDSNRLYGIVSGHLAVSRDGGGSFTTSSESDFTALTAMQPFSVAAFRASGRVYYSANGGGTFSSYVTPSGVTSVGYRPGDSSLMIERNGLLQQLTIFTGQLIDSPAGTQPRTGSLTGDRGNQASYHALSGHSLLRYVDPVGEGVVIPPVAAGDTSVPPPVPGQVVPATQSITLPVGSSGTLPFTLELPKNPTPLDLFFLVDASGSMVDYINSLKSNINRIVGSLKAQHVDLRVGVGTLGSGPRPGEQPYPLTYAYPPDPYHPKAAPRKYNRPVLYRRIRPVGDTGP